MMKVLPQQLRLYAVTDSRRLRGRTLLDTVAAALDGGATFVQLREKELSPAALLEEARALAQLCHARHVPFVVDDNVEVALAAGADGVHVGQSDMAARRARALLGPDKILGVSAHNAAEALAAQADGADYLGCGAAFVTGTKLDAHPVTAETMRAVTAAVNIPVVATCAFTEPLYNYTFTLADGSWPYSNSHCLVLTGYDEDNYYFADPMQEITEIGRDTFALRYEELGCHAVVITQ